MAKKKSSSSIGAIGLKPFTGKIPIYPEYTVKTEAKLRYKKYYDGVALGYVTLEAQNNTGYIIYDIDVSIVDAGNSTTFQIDDGTSTAPPTAQISEFNLGNNKQFHWHSEIGLVFKERIRIYVSTNSDHYLTINGEVIKL